MTTQKLPAGDTAGDSRDLNPILDSSTSAGPSGAVLSSIGDTLIADAPLPQEHAIQEFQIQAKAELLKDTKGAEFSDAVHARNSDGSPRKTSGGEWAKKRGRKAGTATGSADVARSVVAAPGAQVGGSGSAARTIGEGAATTLITVCRSVGGDEWEPVVRVDLGMDEAANLRKLFGDYFVAKNYKDIPPGVALTIGLLGYAGPRFFMPKTRGRLQIAKEWIFAKYLALRVRKSK